MEANATGQIVHEWNPDGAAFTDTTAGTRAVAADLTYTYDPAGRLTKVVDQSDEADGTNCRLRTYRFDARGNRLAHTTAAATTGQACPTTGGEATSHGYDAADRPTTTGDNTAYTYDPLGRQTLIPAADTPHPDAGDIRLSYYDDDTAAAITQAGTSLSYTLDVAGRRTVQDHTPHPAEGRGRVGDEPLRRRLGRPRMGDHRHRRHNIHDHVRRPDQRRVVVVDHNHR